MWNSLKFNTKDTKSMCDICSKSAVKRLEQGVKFVSNSRVNILERHITFAESEQERNRRIYTFSKIIKMKNKQIKQNMKKISHKFSQRYRILSYFYIKAKFVYHFTEFFVYCNCITWVNEIFSLVTSECIYSWEKISLVMIIAW